MYRVSGRTGSSCFTNLFWSQSLKYEAEKLTTLRGWTLGCPWYTHFNSWEKATRGIMYPYEEMSNFENQSYISVFGRLPQRFKISKRIIGEKMNILEKMFLKFQKIQKNKSSSIVKTVAQTDIRKNSYGVFRSFLSCF